MHNWTIVAENEVHIEMSTVTANAMMKCPEHTFGMQSWHTEKKVKLVLWIMMTYGCNFCRNNIRYFLLFSLKCEWQLAVSYIEGEIASCQPGSALSRSLVSHVPPTRLLRPTAITSPATPTADTIWMFVDRCGHTYEYIHQFWRRLEQASGRPTWLILRHYQHHREERLRDWIYDSVIPRNRHMLINSQLTAYECLSTWSTQVNL